MSLRPSSILGSETWHWPIKVFKLSLEDKRNVYLNFWVKFFSTSVIDYVGSFSPQHNIYLGDKTLRHLSQTSALLEIWKNNWSI